MKGVFDTRPNTEYDDDISRRYHFPNVYLTVAERTKNDWIVYREPRRGGGRQAYIAVARVTRIEPDLLNTNHSYAHISDYLEFDQIVPLKSETQYYEDRLNSVDKSSHIGVALQGKSVRSITEEEFGTIVLAGFPETLSQEAHHGLRPEESEIDHTLQTFLESSIEEQKRQVAQILVKKTVRDRAFRIQVVSAYRETCAITGLRMVNHKGNAEVQAAHIRAVQHDGPDIVRNGIALTATCHWLFDHHLISLRDDYSLLVAKKIVPKELQSLFSKQLKRILLPEDKQIWPGRVFMEWHRERFLDR